MICLCKFLSVSVWQSCDKPWRITQLFLITLLCCFSSAANWGKKRLFQLGLLPPPELHSLPHALLLCECACVCELFGNLSNFTLVKFPCKRQHFRKKPSGWVNVISECVCVPVGVWVCQEVDRTQIANIQSGAGSSLSRAPFYSLGHAHSFTQAQCITILLLTFLRQNEVISHLLLFVISGLPRQAVPCVFLWWLCFLSVCFSLSLSFSLSNLCVVGGAGADRPRDGI